MITRRLAHWIASAIAFLAVSHLVPGFTVPDFATALAVSLAYGFLVLVASLLLLPFAYTLFLFVPRAIWNGLCLLLVNSALLIACTTIVRTFQVESYGSACAAAVLLSVITAVLSKLLT
jgi:uncharacterized membrane protein YvlD (DUF360 family)